MSDYGSNPDIDMNVVQKIAQDYNFMPLDKANAMQWDSGSAILDIKIAHRRTGSNCHFLIDTNQL